MKFLFGLFCLVSFTLQATQIQVVDVAGREVKINVPVKRVMLADSRVLLALNILHPAAPLQGIVAWDDAFIKKTPDLAKAYQAKNFPINKIPIFPNPYTSDFNVENALQYHPDLIIFDIGLLTKLNDQNVLNQLAKINIPVIFIDLRQYPVKNTVPSITLLGDVFSAQKNAEKFIAFYNARLKLISDRTKDIPRNKRPSVFIERHAGLFPGANCCITFGKGSFGEMVDAAGGNNVGDQWFTGMGGEVNPEQLLSSPADIYLMTVSDWRGNNKKSQSVPLGYFADKTEINDYYNKLINRPIIKTLKPVQEGKALALYHQYYDTPFNIIAIEVIAKFIYPDRFKDIDPEADSIYLHKEFTSIDGNGIFWFPAFSGN